MRVIAIDPGERCGWATGVIRQVSRPCYDQAAGDHDVIEWELRVEAHGISFLKDMALALHEKAAEYDVIIYETFRLTAHGAKVLRGNDMQTSQMIGMIRLCAWLNPRVQLVPQTPGDKTTARLSLKHGGDDVAARLAKLPKSHDESHDGDALLHLWKYYFSRYV